MIFRCMLCGLKTPNECRESFLFLNGPAPSPAKPREKVERGSPRFSRPPRLPADPYRPVSDRISAQPCEGFSVRGRDGFGCLSGLKRFSETGEGLPGIEPAAMREEVAFRADVCASKGIPIFFACFFPRPVAWKESLAIWPPPELSHVFCLCASSHAEKRKRVIAFGRSGAKSLQAPFSCRRGCLPSARSFFLFRHILDRRGGGRSGMDDVCRRFDAAARDSDDGHLMRRRMGCLTCRRTRCRLDRPAWRGYRDLTGRNGLSRGDANVGFSRFPDHGSHCDRWEPKSFRPPLLESLRSLGGCGLPVGMAPVAAARAAEGVNG